ncbi:Bikaverin cluster transcription factor bik5-like protein [Cladobotryum mycophilum]|uniref:Bikaverin cluster transcription factor bik5-like protein n=1 Tax=Cladobotryum mycophilum TaxID=491253 RepID=A0ABR0SL05_9HYPO
MTTPFDSNRGVRRAESSPSAPSSRAQTQQEQSSSSGHHSHNVTIYQTTGLDAHKGPIMTPGSSDTPLLNPRSCVTCRRRKVRCDKQMPCSNCRRALIPCVFPAPGRAPRQHRPKDPNAPAKTTSQREVELVKRLKKLEGIFPSAAGSPEVAANGASPTSQRILGLTGASPKENSSPSEGSEAARRKDVQKAFGRLVLDDNKGTSRYVSSGFWSKLNDELDAIREETQRLTDEDHEESDYEEGSQTESPATAIGAGYDHHGFIVGYRSIDVNLTKCHPLPSHATFLWSVYQENVDSLIKLLHIPTAENLFREARKNPEKLSPSNEALVFSIYFAAIIALEPDEVHTNFGTSKDELASQYRFALEQSLAKANFLNTSDLTVLQAFTIFLMVVRRVDDSRFCWSLTALLIRIGQGMGLHRDGIQFGLSPFETELRRRLWWAILTLDLRCTEELGSDMVVDERSYDTLMPTNINDADISPSSSDFPKAREGRSDCAVSLVRYEICALSRRLLSASSAMSPGSKDEDATVAEKERMLIDVYQRVEHKFLQHVVDEVDPLYWVAAMISRVIMAKMCLVIYQPMLFPGSEYELSEEIRQRIYVAAIEIIEYNYKLNTDPRCKQYRWLFKTYTHWHAIAYTLIETCRRPWTALVERGWEAILSYDRDPIEYAKKADHAAVFLPLRKLFMRAKRHREFEVTRLKANPDEARQLDFAERMNPAQARFGPVPGAEGRMEQTRERWRVLVRPDDANPTPYSSRLHVPANSVTSESSTPQAASHFQPTPQVQSPSNNENQPAVGISDVTMEYMNDFMARPGISMAELWSMNLSTSSDDKNMNAPTNELGPTVSQDGQITNEKLRQQAMLMQTQPPKDDNLPPYLWSDPFTAMNTRFDDKVGEDMDMLGEDFNWHNWSQSIRGLEMESTQPKKDW